MSTMETSTLCVVTRQLEEVMRSMRVHAPRAPLSLDDAAAFMHIAARTQIRTAITCYPLEQANRALADLRAGVLAAMPVRQFDRLVFGLGVADRGGGKCYDRKSS